MPTILTHAAVPIALGLSLGAGIVSRRLLAAGVLASILPDLDVLAFRIGIPYAHDFGHRGASHSLAFATLLGLLALALSTQLRTTRSAAFLFVFIAAASHGLLDMLTNGGLGVALAWPVSDARYFFPARVIEVSPLNVHRFFSPTGAAVLLSELRWVWLPSAITGIVIFFVRRKTVR